MQDAIDILNEAVAPYYFLLEMMSKKNPESEDPGLLHGLQPYSWFY
jgi:hypothetical protein